ncbi:hypothetical protein GW17_00048845 [Ensete ventricosum]|nr:hypothetical protein GW17_00048845 [Ensete ventricosum]
MGDKITDLRSEIQELKEGPGPAVVAMATKCVADLQAKIEWLKTKLTELGQQCWELKEAIGSTMRVWLSSISYQRICQHHVQARIQKVEGTTFSKISTGKPSVSGGSTGIAQDFRRLSAAEPPRLGG